MSQKRLRILCEDRRTDRFVRRLCERYGVQVLSVERAPNGKGAASAWVRHRYPHAVRLCRSKNFQQNLGLLVVIDGDNRDLDGRLRELGAELDALDVPKIGPADPIAVFVPTWSVETWLAYLCEQPGVDESRSLKDDPADRALWADGAVEAATIRQAVAAWNPRAVALPSLTAAYREAGRVGLA